MPSRSVWSRDQVRLTDLKARRQPLQHLQCDVPPAVLDARKIGHVDARAVGQFVLGQAAFQPQAPDVPPHNFPQIHRWMDDDAGLPGNRL